MKKIIIANLFASALAIAFAQAPAAGDAARGKELYIKNGCYECHGTVGQGGTGPHIAPRTAPITYVRRPAGQMPPYTAKVLPDSDLADILAYLKTIPAPPAEKAIAILNQ